MVALAGLGTALLLAWLAWFVWARVSLYETSQRARLEAVDVPHDLDAPLTGRILRTPVGLDEWVEAGDVLVEFDSAELVVQKEAEESQLAALVPQIEALERELTSQSQAILSEQRAVGYSLTEAKARQRAVTAISELKELERQQIQSLRNAQVVAEVDRQRGQADAEQKIAEVQAAAAQVERLGREGRAKRSDRLAQVARLQADIAGLIGERVQSAGRMGILKQRIALHTVRAPIRGRVAHATPLKPGAVVAAGARLCTVVPAGAVRIVGFFPAATSAGRLHQGQPARLRLSAFPWTKYGVVHATVERVGQEPREGLLRVELSLSPGQNTAIPIQHGLSGLVEVEVEKVSPLALVLDAAGRYMMGREAADPTGVPATSP